MDKRKTRYKYLKRILLIYPPILLVATLYYLFFLFSEKLNLALFDCVFYRTFGISCMGCGGTRAVRALFHLDLSSCFFYYPPIFLCTLLLFLLLVFYTLSAVFGDETYAKRFPLYLFYFVPLSIVLVFFVRLVLSFFGISYFSFFL